MLSLLFFLVCYATSILLFLGGVQHQERPSDLSFSAFLPCAIADIVLILVFIFVENRVFKLKINIPLIIILSCLFIINMIVIITTPLEKSFEYNYYGEWRSTLVLITNEWKVMYIFCFFLMLLNIYISFNYLISRIVFKKHFIWICSLVITIGLIMVLYSYIAEWETYKLFLENITTTVRGYNPKSFTSNFNNYAAILLGAGFCSYGLYATTRKPVFWILGLFFCVNTVFPMSRICLLLSITLTLMVFVYTMVITWTNHKFRNANFIFLLVAPISLLIVMCFNVTEMRNYIVNILITNHSSINARKPLWDIAITMTQGIHCFVGNGHGYFNTAFTTMNALVKMPHNLYIQTYASLGYLGLTSLAALFCFIIYKIIRLFKNNRDAAFISIIGLIIVLSYYVVEG